MAESLTSPASSLDVDERSRSMAARTAWAFFEFAGGPWFVVVQIFVFAPYFANVIVPGDPITGQAYWGYIGGAAGLLVALFSPFVGSIADQYGPRKPGIAVFTLLALPFMAALWWSMPGTIAMTAIAVVMATFLFELAFIFHNAMLPVVAPPHRLGIVSASGYAMSYAGAIVAFAIWLALPALGFGGTEADGHAQSRAAGPLALVFAVVFMLPLLILAPDAPWRGRTVGACVASGVRSLGETIGQVRAYRNIGLYLVARMIYYDGLTAVFAFVGIYASAVFGWTSEAGIYGLIIVLTAAISAVIGGLVDDRIGSRATILVSLVCFAVCLAANLGTDPGQIAFLFPVSPAAPGLPILGSFLGPIGFDTLPEQVFVLIGVCGGLFVGPALSSSRTLMARLAPEDKVAAFFGLYNLTGRATAFLAPLAIGVVTQFSGDQRTGLGVIFIFIAIGFFLLLAVREVKSS